MWINDDAEPNTLLELEAMSYNPCVDPCRAATQVNLDEAIRKSIEKLKPTLILLSSR